MNTAEEAVIPPSKMLSDPASDGAAMATVTMPVAMAPAHLRIGLAGRATGGSGASSGTLPLTFSAPLN